MIIPERTETDQDRHWREFRASIEPELEAKRKPDILSDTRGILRKRRTLRDIERDNARGNCED